MKANVEILRGFGAFTRVITEGRIYEEKPIRAFVGLSKAKQSIIRVGFAVSKNVKRAVDRNLLRRYLRESFRNQIDCLIEKVGKEMMVTVVFMYAAKAEGVFPIRGRLPSISAAMRKILEKMKAICEE